MHTVDPLVVVLEPVGQGVQESESAEFEYVPGGQFSQVVVADEELLELEVIKIFPAGHCRKKTKQNKKIFVIIVCLT